MLTHLQFIQFWRQMKTPRTKLCEKFAECASSQSHLSKRIGFPDVGALDSLLLAIMINVYTEWNQGYWRDLALEKLYKKAKAHNFQGHWNTLREYLEGIQMTEEKAFYFLCKHFSTRDIFGNLIPQALRLSRAIRIKESSVLRPYKRPLRKRGYDDKGTLLLPHQIHSAWEFSGPNPEKEEMEHQRPRHPKEWFPKEQSRGERWEPERVRKEADCCVQKDSNRTSDQNDRREDESSQPTETVSLIPDKGIRKMNLFG